MANEGADNYKPEGKEIERNEREMKKIQARAKVNKAIEKAKKKEQKSNANGNGNGNDKGNGKADYKIFISFEQWQAKLLEKYNKLYDTVQQNIPHLWPSLEFDLSIKNILHIKDITQPFAGIVLGKPSSLKTVGLEMFRKSDNTHYTDNFTAKSFVSHNTGLSEERLQEIDLLPKIRNKCFLTPELAPVFAAKDDDLLQLLGIMTRVLDGYGYESDTGAQGHRGYRERMMFTWIGAAVDIPFKVHKLMTTLGPRLYFLRVPSTQNKTDDNYFAQLEYNDFDVRRNAIQSALIDYQNWLESACPIMEHDDIFNSDLKKMPWVNGNAKDYDKTQYQKQPYMHIIKLGKLLAHLRGVVRTWDTEGTQGSEYGYSLPIIEEPDRAMQQLANLARGHALQKGNNYITIEDIPMIIKVVLSTAPIERVAIFDILLANNGILTVNQITDLLNVSEPTARRTMTELKALGLVDTQRVDAVCNDGKIRNSLIITLKEQFNWFLSEEFDNLRQGFKPTQENENENGNFTVKEKYPPHREPQNAENNTENHNHNHNYSPLRGGEISFIENSSSSINQAQNEGSNDTNGTFMGSSVYAYNCYYCPFGTNGEGVYTRHTVNTHHKAAFPNRAQRQKDGLEDKGNPWEEQD